MLFTNKHAHTQTRRPRSGRRPPRGSSLRRGTMIKGVENISASQVSGIEQTNLPLTLTDKAKSMKVEWSDDWIRQTNHWIQKQCKMVPRQDVLGKTHTHPQRPQVGHQWHDPIACPHLLSPLGGQGTPLSVIWVSMQYYQYQIPVRCLHWIWCGYVNATACLTWTCHNMWRSSQLREGECDGQLVSPRPLRLLLPNLVGGNLHCRSFPSLAS